MMAKEAFDFDEHERQQVALIDALRAEPQAEILGVVDANGVGGSNFSKDAQWTMRLTFASWQIKDSTVRESPLNVVGLVSKDNLERHMASITAYSILRIHARIDQNSVNQPETALLEKVLEFNAESEAMNSVIKKLREPVYRDDSFFGRLQLNRKINQFETRAPWLGTEV